MTDKPILDFVESRMVRLQNATGVPIWKYSANTWRIYAVTIVIRGEIRHDDMKLSMLWACFIILIYSFNERNKRLQAQADRTNMMVTNPRVTHWVVRTIGLYLVVADIVWLVSGIERLSLMCTVPLCLGLYLASCNYWPMTGQTIWSKVKASLTVRKTANA